MRYQFQVDFRPAAPVRFTWEEAASDAVNAGYGLWTDDGIKLNEQASIERISE